MRSCNNPPTPTQTLKPQTHEKNSNTNFLHHLPSLYSSGAFEQGTQASS